MAKKEMNYAEEYIKHMNSNITFDEFYDKCKVPLELRSDHLTAIIIHNAKKILKNKEAKGMKVKINQNYLKNCIKQFTGKEKQELQQILNNKGIATIKNQKTGHTFTNGTMKENTQYLIDYGWKIGIGGIPLNKVEFLKKQGE